jgi:hypothetical protein
LHFPSQLLLRHSHFQSRPFHHHGQRSVSEPCRKNKPIVAADRETEAGTHSFYSPSSILGHANLPRQSSHLNRFATSPILPPDLPFLRTRYRFRRTPSRLSYRQSSSRVSIPCSFPLLLHYSSCPDFLHLLSHTGPLPIPSCYASTDGPSDYRLIFPKLPSSWHSNHPLILSIHGLTATSSAATLPATSVTGHGPPPPAQHI